MSVLRVVLSVLLLLCLSSCVLASSKGQQSLEAMAPVGEGTACNFRGSNGKCTAGTCNAGYKVSGRCPGPASVRCCLPGSPNDNAGHYDQPAATVRKSLAGAFPYKFPYSTARHIVADIAKQRIRLYDGSTKVKEWKISSGKNGISFTPNSLGSPSGRFRVIGRYGDGAPLGMQFEAFKAIGKIGYPTDAKAHVQTRILQISGLDKENANTAARSIYIHGTNAEMQLGWKGSHGCFRMGNADVVELFNMVKTGVEFYSVPSGAWPN